MSGVKRTREYDYSIRARGDKEEGKSAQTVCSLEFSKEGLPSAGWKKPLGGKGTVDWGSKLGVRGDAPLSISLGRKN